MAKTTGEDGEIKETITIASIKQLASYADKLPDEYEWFKTVHFEFAEKIEGIQMHFKGAQFDSTLNTSMMEGIIKLQNAIYKQYSLFVYGEIKTLSLEERKALELYVKIQPGSSLYDLLA